MTTTQVVVFTLLWIVIIAEGVLLFLLYQHMGLLAIRKSKRMSGLAVGTRAPALLAQTNEGVMTGLDQMLAHDYTLLVFGSLTCSGCRTLLMDRKVRAFLQSQSIPGYFLVDRSDDNSNSMVPAADVSLALLAVERKAFTAFAVPVTPFGYVITQTGTIVASGALGQFQRLVELCEQAQGADRDYLPTVSTSPALTSSTSVK